MSAQSRKTPTLTAIHAAGNDGPDYFDIDFLNADVRLSSNKPSGKVDGFSSSNSLATKADGVLPVVLNPEVDVLDPTSIKEQKGTFEIVGTGIVIPNDSLTHFIGNTRREKFWYPTFSGSPTNPEEH